MRRRKIVKETRMGKMNKKILKAARKVNKEKWRDRGTR